MLLPSIFDCQKDSVGAELIARAQFGTSREATTSSGRVVRTYTHDNNDEAKYLNIALRISKSPIGYSNNRYRMAPGYGEREIVAWLDRSVKDYVEHQTITDWQAPLGR